MHAVQFDAYGGPDVLRLREISSPLPANGEVLIDVHAASLNPLGALARRLGLLT